MVLSIELFCISRKYSKLYVAPIKVELVNDALLCMRKNNAYAEERESKSK